MAKNHMDNIILVRHAHSLANEDFSLPQKIADSEISLSSAGFQQAAYGGQALVSFLTTLTPAVTHVNFIVSPYLRAAQTADTMIQACQSQYAVSYKTNSLVQEKGLGKFEGYGFDEITGIFGQEAEEFLQRFNDPETKYAARPPNRVKGDKAPHTHRGESYQMCNNRIREFMNNDVHGPRALDAATTVNVIVAHGRVNTFIEKELMAKPDSDYLNIPITHNCAFKFFQRNTKTGLFEDQGLIFEGFANAKEFAVEKPFSQLKS